MGGCRHSAQTASLLAEPPGPPTLPLFGNLHNFDMGKMQIGDMRGLYADHGAIARVRLPGQSLVFLSDVDMAKEVLQKRASDFAQGEHLRKAMGHFFPASLFVVEGKDWQRIRRIMAKAMQGTQVAALLQPMWTVIDRADSHSIHEGEACDVHRLSGDITFDAFGLWALGVDLNLVQGDSRDLLEACEEVARAFQYNSYTRPFPILWSLPTPYNTRVDKALSVMKEYASRFLRIAEARAGNAPDAAGLDEQSQTNLLDAMVHASLAEEDAKQRLTEEEMIDNLAASFFGAYDTTSATLAFTLHLLAENPAAQEELAAEVAGVNLADLSKEELEGLPFLDCVTKEANRVRPTAWGFARTAMVDTEVGGYSIPKGTHVLIDHVARTARDPALWGQQQDLEEFRPSRWKEVSPPKLASLPFGFGSRICLGKQVATVEHKQVTAALVQRYRWRTDPTRPLQLTSVLGLCPKDGCWLVPERRSD